MLAILLASQLPDLSVLFSLYKISFAAACNVCAHARRHMLALIDCLRCRAAKPFRALEDIMIEEQTSAATSASASLAQSVDNSIQPEAAPTSDAAAADAPGADAQAARLQQDVRTDELVEQIEASIQTADAPMDLAATEEVLDLFSEYYKDDCEAASTTIIDDADISCSIDYSNEVLEPSYVMQRAAPAAAATLGSNTESFDVMALL